MTVQSDIARFTEVDRTPDPSFFVEFMDAANGIVDVQALKPRLLDLLSLSRGASSPRRASQPTARFAALTVITSSSLPAEAVEGLIEVAGAESSTPLLSVELRHLGASRRTSQ
jgi:hypothetical protein